MTNLEKWEKLAKAALDGKLGPEWPGDPDSNVMELARAVKFLLEDRETKRRLIHPVLSHPLVKPTLTDPRLRGPTTSLWTKLKALSDDLAKG